MVFKFETGTNTSFQKHSTNKEDMNDNIEDDDDISQMIVIIYNSVKTSYRKKL